MKYLISCLLAFSILNAKAQKKIYFTVFVGSNFTASKKVENEFNTIEHYTISRVGDTFNLGKNYFHYNLKSSYTGKCGFSLGVKANFDISNHFTVSGGVAISQFAVKRKNSESYTLTKTEQLTVIYTPPPGAEFFTIPGLERTGYEKFSNYYYYVYEENIKATVLQIPIEISLKSNQKSKFEVRLGFTPVILLNYELTPNKVTGTEILGTYTPKRLDSNEDKFQLTTSIGFGFPLYKNLSGNIYYNRYFKTITEGTVIPKLTPTIYGLSLVYKIPNFKLNG
jgi:hypothetical protein